MSYVVWHSMYQKKRCALGALEGVPRDGEILKGRLLRDADFPKDVQTPDNLYSMIHHVVSERLRKVLEPALAASRVEFLPVKIKNHEGRFAPGSFFVMNPLDVIDCIDVAASGGEYNDLDRTQLVRVQQLVLSEPPGEPAMFRPVGWTRLILVRSDVVDRLMEADLEGLVFWELDEFRGDRGVRYAPRRSIHLVWRSSVQRFFRSDTLSGPIGVVQTELSRFE